MSNPVRWLVSCAALLSMASMAPWACSDGDRTLAALPADDPGGAPAAPALPVDAGGSPAGPVQEALPALPSVRQEHSVVALGGEIYVLGGFTPNVTSTMQAFDPASGRWRNVAEAPLALHHANAAVVDGRLIVAGYYVGTSVKLAPT